MGSTAIEDGKEVLGGGTGEEVLQKETRSETGSRLVRLDSEMKGRRVDRGGGLTLKEFPPSPRRSKTSVVVGPTPVRLDPTPLGTGTGFVVVLSETTGTTTGYDGPSRRPSLAEVLLG